MVKHQKWTHSNKLSLFLLFWNNHWKNEMNVKKNRRLNSSCSDDPDSYLPILVQWSSQRHAFSLKIQVYQTFDLSTNQVQYINISPTDWNPVCQVKGPLIIRAHGCKTYAQDLDNFYSVVSTEQAHTKKGCISSDNSSKNCCLSK